MDNSPAPPVPDDKDWTWVLDRPCPDCGFDAGAMPESEVGSRLRANTAAWVDLLTTTRAAELSGRPAPQVWSPLEYACHVRDVHVLYLSRLELMLDEDGPRYPNWDQDETAIAERYHEADPATVASELQAASDALADRLDQVEGDDWNRTGYRSDGAEFTVTTFAKYFIHDPIHHLHDVGVG